MAGRTGGAGTVVQLLYARPDPEGVEPLVAVTRTEDEARALESEVAVRHPATRVTWETHDVHGTPVDTVHLVVLDAGGSDGDEPLDPVTVGVHAHREAAEEDADQRAAGEPSTEHVVLSLPLDWRRPGWPFTEDGVPPGS